MNTVKSQKYGFVPNVVESEKFRDIYDFYRLINVK